MYAKAEEIKILETAAKKLGENSYLGPAILALLPALEADMRSDFMPDLVGYLNCMEKDLAAKKEDLKDAEARIKALNQLKLDRENELRRLETHIEAAKEKIRSMCGSLNQLAA